METKSFKFFISFMNWLVIHISKIKLIRWVKSHWSPSRWLHLLNWRESLFRLSYRLLSYWNWICLIETSQCNLNRDLRGSNLNPLLRILNTFRILLYSMTIPLTLLLSTFEAKVSLTYSTCHAVTSNRLFNIRFTLRALSKCIRNFKFFTSSLMWLHFTRWANLLPAIWAFDTPLKVVTVVFKGKGNFTMYAVHSVWWRS